MGIYPIIYCGILGSNIGSIVFPIIGTTRVIRDILANNKEIRKDDKSLEQIQKFFDIHLSN
jgi:membrane protein DedA with SNARE-associated domain